MADFTAEQVRRGVALSSIRSTYADLDRWRARSSRVEVPQVGSELDVDSKIFPGFAFHQVARISLIAAVQHLNLSRTALEAKEVFPIAHPAVLRGALLSAARGVWLLHPDSSHDRQQRGLRVVYEIHKRYLQYLDMSSLGLDPSELAPAREEIESRRDAVRVLWAATSDMKPGESVSETDTIDRAATTFADVAKGAAVRAMWRTHSGDAHGLIWPSFTRVSTGVESLGKLSGYPGRMAEYTPSGDVLELAQWHGPCFELLRRGWSLFDQRCEA